MTVDSLEQRYLLAPADVKDAYVVHVLREYLAAEEHKRSSVLLFCSTRKYAQLLAMVLRRFGLESASLHAALKQRERLRVLQRFKSLQTRILIATDLASRCVRLYTTLLEQTTVARMISYNRNLTKKVVEQLTISSRQYLKVGSWYRYFLGTFNNYKSSDCF